MKETKEIAKELKEKGNIGKVEIDKEDLEDNIHKKAFNINIIYRYIKLFSEEFFV